MFHVDGGCFFAYADGDCADAGFETVCQRSAACGVADDAFGGASGMAAGLACAWAAAVLLTALPAAKCGFLCPKKVWTFEYGEETPEESVFSGVSSVETPSGNKSMGLVRAWTPYVLIGILLLCTRLNVFGIKTFLTSECCTVQISNLLGVEAVSWKWDWGWCPGIVPFLLICAVSCFYLGMRWKEMKSAGSVRYFAHICN